MGGLGSEARAFFRHLKLAWFYMLEPPWQHSLSNERRGGHWAYWAFGWAWALAGLVGGALVAPSLVQFVGLSHTPYQDWFVIGIAVLAGFFVQFLGWALTLATIAFEVRTHQVRGWTEYLYFSALVSPFAAVGYALYRYFTLVGSDQRTVTVAFAGGLLAKTLVIPFIKGIVTGAAFKVLMGWLRGGKKKST